MNVKVSNFLENERKKEINNAKKEKKRLLIDLGLYEKEFSDSYKPGFSYYDSDSKKYYKIVPVDVTDEEYEEIKHYSQSKVEDTKCANPIARTLKIIAIIEFIVGFIFGLFLISKSFLLTVTCWLAIFVSGVTFIGFGEIINLLDEIKDKSKR